MKYKILIIFFISCIMLYIVFNCYYKENNDILILGESKIMDYIDSNGKYNTFLYDKTSYKHLINSINNNDKKIVKNKKIYLNQLIYSSKYIIIYVDNKCSDNNYILNKIDKLSNKIKKINNSYIYIVDNGCNLLKNESNNYNIINMYELNMLLNKLSY